MEKLLKGIKSVVVFIDDILIARESDKANLESMELLRRIEDANLRWSWRNVSFWRAALISWGIEFMLKDSTLLTRRSRLSRMPLHPPLYRSLSLILGWLLTIVNSWPTSQPFSIHSTNYSGKAASGSGGALAHFRQALDPFRPKAEAFAVMWCVCLWTRSSPLP